MPLEFQAKLLRVLVQREICRVGGSRNRRINTRIICATNCDLAELVRRGRFRSDLFHRLNVGVIRLRPLRERRSAIAPLAQQFLTDIARELGKPFQSISPAAIAALEQHDWPGNIRELRNTMARALMVHQDRTLRPEHLHFVDAQTPADASRPDPGDPRGCQLNLGGLVLPQDGLDLARLEAEIIRKALEMNGGNKSRTARYLGLTRSRLLSRLAHLQEPSTVENQTSGL